MISKQKRTEITDKVAKLCTQDWDNSPAGQRRFEIEEELMVILADKQLEDIPVSDRVVLEKYEFGYNSEHAFTIVRDSEGKYREVWRSEERVGHKFGIVRYCLQSYSGNSDYNLFNYLHGVQPALIDEWYDIMEVRKCEIDKQVKAWDTIILNSKSIKQLVVDFPEVRRYVPWYLIEPSQPQEPRDLTAEVEIIKSFNA